MIPIRFGRALLSALLKVFAFWVLLVAAYLALGRQFFPEVEHYNDELAAVLTEKLGTEVRIGRLEGRWQRFNPVLIAEDVVVGERIAVRRLLLEPSVMQSLVNLSPVFGRFELDGFSARLEQGANGWRLVGLGGGSSGEPNGASGGNRLSIDRLASLVRQQRQVTFSDLTLIIEPQNLPTTTLVMTEGRLTGAGENNWLRADAHLVRDSLDVPIELQVESVRRDDDHEVDVYARHGAFDFAPWLRSRLPWLAELDVSGEYWLSLRQDRWRDLTVRLNTDRARLDGVVEDLVLDDARTELYLTQADSGFDLWLNQLDQDWSLGERSLTSADRPVRARVSRRGEQWQAHWDQLPLAPLSAWLSLGDNGGFWRRALPQGSLQQGRLSLIDGDGSSLQLNANLIDASMQPAGGAPGLSGLSGELKVDGQRARLSYDNTDVGFNLINIYDEPFRFARLSGQLDASWQPGVGAQLRSRHRATLAPSDAQRQAGLDGLAMDASWRLTLPFGDPDRELGYQLAIEVPEAPLGWVQRLRPDRQIPQNARDWIAGNILAGDFHDLSFGLTTAHSDGRLVQTGLSLDAGFSDAEVRVHPDWPLLSGGDGRVVIGLDRLDVSADGGELAGLSLQQGELSFPYAEQRLDLDLALDGPAQATLALFQKGPLANLAGTTLADWRAEGRTRGQLKLALPLNGGAPDVDVRGRLSDGRLVLPQPGLDIKELNGDLNYDSERGLHADNVSGFIFGSRYRAVMRSPQRDDEQLIELDIRGTPALADWGRWLNDPWLAAREERTPARARLRFGRDIEIDLSTNLIGVPLALPQPLGKPAQQARPLSIQLQRPADEGGWRINLSYDTVLNAVLNLEADNGFSAGTLALNQPLRLRPDEMGLFIDARLDEADIEAWQQALSQQLAVYEPASALGSGDGAAGGGPLPWLREVNLSGDQWRYLRQDWHQPQLQIQRGDEAWLASLSAEEGAGRLSQPFEPGAPLFVDLEFVALPARDDEAESEQAPPQPEVDIDPLQAARPEDIPLMNIQIAQLSVGERDLGSWRLEMVPGEDEVEVRNIRAEVPGGNLTGRLVWRYLDNRHRTELNGEVDVGNIQTLLDSWGYAPVLVSDNGHFELDLDWNGSPAFFGYDRLEGRIGLELNDGAILELDEYEGVKLVGLLNFTRVLRRLALDFSDLINDGITFDVVRGELLFDRGFARVGEQLIIDGPATKFSFSGDADLVRDQLDVDMVMTVPLSSTFPLVALLAGVTPQAAAAIYVTERVFNNELERLSSARVHVTGSLDDPELRFYRVFDSSTRVPDAEPGTEPGNNGPDQPDE